MAMESEWEKKFAKEREILRAVFGMQLVSTHLIGSAALHGVTASSALDILVILKAGADIDSFESHLRRLGFTPGSEPSHRQSQSVHLFIYEQGDPRIGKAIALKEYLLAHPEAARDYENLKKSASEESYEQAKRDFLSSIQPLADAWKETLCE